MRIEVTREKRAASVLNEVQKRNEPNNARNEKHSEKKKTNWNLKRAQWGKLSVGAKEK